jgi:hypothetical protein
MQVMLVPNDLTRTLPDKNDWPYSGALVASHSLYSADSAENWAIQNRVYVALFQGLYPTIYRRAGSPPSPAAVFFPEAIGNISLTLGW